MAIIEIKDAIYTYSNKYQTVEALKSVSYKFEQGKIYALVGKSGSGKSTMLSLLAGLEEPDFGHVFYKGESTSDMNLDVYRREKVAMIYQDFKLFPMLTVQENIMYIMELNGYKSRVAKAKAVELADKVGLDKTHYHRYPAMISGGEQQRVSIARALTMERKLILADEPTGNLDSENSENIIQILIDLAKKENCCVIIATHDLGIAPLMDDVITMKDGEIQ